MNGFEILGRLVLSALIICWWLLVSAATARGVYVWTASTVIAFVVAAPTFIVGCGLSLPSVLPGVDE